LEKTKIEVRQVQRTKDYFGWLLAFAIVLLLIELLGKWTVLRSLTP